MYVATQRSYVTKLLSSPHALFQNFDGNVLGCTSLRSTMEKFMIDIRLEVADASVSVSTPMKRKRPAASSASTAKGVASAAAAASDMDVDSTPTGDEEAVSGQIKNVFSTAGYEVLDIEMDAVQFSKLLMLNKDHATILNHMFGIACCCKLLPS